MKTRKMERYGGSRQAQDWIYGLNPVLEALKSGRAVKALFLSSGRHEKTAGLLQEAGERNIPVKIKDISFFDNSFGKGHQGVAAQVSSREYIPVSDLIDIPFVKGEIPFFIVLDCVEDPRNFGAVLRVADAAGVHGIVLQSHRSVTLSADIAKVSAGAVEYVPVAMVPNIKHAIHDMREKGIEIIGAEGEAETALWDTDLSVPVALVIGSEGKGMRKTVRDLCDILIRIPMMGKVNSLNVAVAAGVFCFEILRQRVR